MRMKSGRLRSKVQRAMIFLLTGILLFGLAACGGANSDVASTESGSAIASDTGSENAGSASGTQGEDNDPNELVWVMSSVENPLDGEYYYVKMYEGDVYFSGYKIDNELYRFSFETGESETYSLTWPEEFLAMQHKYMALDQIAVGLDGSLYVIASCCIDDTGNRTPFLCKFDTAGQCVYTQNIVEQMRAAGAKSWSSVFRLEVDTQDRVYLSHEFKVFLYNADGSYHGEIEVIEEKEQGDKWICDIKRGLEDKVYLHYSRKWGNPGFLAEFDFENKKLSTIYEMSYGREMCFSTDGGLFVSKDRHGLYEYTEMLGAENQVETLHFDWLDYSMNGQMIERMTQTADGRLIVLYKLDQENYDVLSFEQMTRAEAEALKAGKKTVTIGVFGDPGEGLTNAVVEFNKESEEVIVEIENYVDSSLADAVQVGMERLNSELAAGKGPDIIDVQYLDLESLVEKGVFEDLQAYLSKRGGLAASNFPESILSAYTVGDVLVAIPHEFIMQTIVGPSGLLGEESGWTLQELLTFAEENRGTDLFNRMTKSQLMETLLLFNEELFIDWEKGTCSFDSEEFQGLLTLVSGMSDKLTASDIQTSIFTSLQNEEVLLANVRINQYGELQPYAAAFGGKMTCIGYPATEGSGCLGTAYGLFALSSQSKEKEEAWDFLEYYLQQDSTVGTFPSLEKTMKAQIEEYRESSDTMVTKYPDGWQYEHHEATQEEIDQFYALVAAARFDTVSQEVLTIIAEEAESFFLGQKPVDVVAGIIQNRVRNYMEENR